MGMMKSNLYKPPQYLGNLLSNFIKKNLEDAFYYDDTCESPRLKIQSIQLPHYKNYYLIDFKYDTTTEDDIEQFIVYTHPITNKSYWYPKHSVLFSNEIRGPFGTVLTAMEDLERELSVEFEGFIWNNYFEIYKD